MDESAAKTGLKQRGKPFQPGVSGNQAGRPKGARHRHLVALDTIGTEAAHDVLQATIAAARNGDMVACRVLLDRLWPARKGRAFAFALPSIADAAGLAAASAGVIHAVASAEMSPEEGSAVAALLDVHRRVIETVVLSDRIAALENGTDR